MDVADLVRVLKTGTPQEQMTAAREIGALGAEAGPEAAPVLLERMRDAPPALRIAAREALTKLGDAGVRALLYGLPSRDCAVALKEIAPQAAKYLLAALGDRSFRGRADALWALAGSLGKGTPVPPEVVDCLADPEPEVRENAQRLVKEQWESVYPSLRDRLPKAGLGADFVRELLLEDAEGAIGRGDEVRLGLVVERLDLRDDHIGGFLLGIAAGTGQVKIAANLIEKGAPKDAKAGWPLQHAVSNDQVDAARLLLENKAEPNRMDEYGGRPLHRAESGGMIKLLLEHGADRAAKSKEGQTPYESFVNQLNESIKHSHWRPDDLPQMIDLVAPAGAPLAAELLAKAEAATKKEHDEAAARARSQRKKKSLTLPKLTNVAAYCCLVIQGDAKPSSFPFSLRSLGKRAAYCELFRLKKADAESVRAGELLAQEVSDLPKLVSRDSGLARTLLYAKSVLDQAGVELESSHVAALAKTGTAFALHLASGSARKRGEPLRSIEEGRFAGENVAGSFVVTLIREGQQGVRLYSFDEQEEKAEGECAADVRVEDRANRTRALEAVGRWLQANPLASGMKELMVSEWGEGEEYNLLVQPSLLSVLAGSGAGLEYILND
ncbi:MAG TPA: hypothetical protein DFS52_31480 [Myxococcales bacterium]|jgi:hypothetical protein|nr:hypothetical protein [Myxococcales bacterium]